MNVRGSGRGSGVEQQHKVALKLITDAIDCMPDVRSKVVEYLLTRYGYEITLRLINLSATASPQGGGGGDIMKKFVRVMTKALGVIQPSWGAFVVVGWTMTGLSLYWLSAMLPLCIGGCPTIRDPVDAAYVGLGMGTIGLVLVPIGGMLKLFDLFRVKSVHRE